MLLKSSLLTLERHLEDVPLGCPHGWEILEGYRSPPWKHETDRFP